MIIPWHIKGEAPLGWGNPTTGTDLTQSEGGLSGVPKAVGGPGKVPEEGVDVIWVISTRVALLLLQKQLQLLERHVLLVLTVAAKLLSQLQDNTVQDR